MTISYIFVNITIIERTYRQIVCWCDVQQSCVGRWHRSLRWLAVAARGRHTSGGVPQAISERIVWPVWFWRLMGKGRAQVVGSRTQHLEWLAIDAGLQSVAADGHPGAERLPISSSIPV